jgi:phytoene dehydrogenase-like protein
LEANDTIGGGARSAETTLPGFVHDLGSAIHPLGLASPFFKSLPLEEHGLEWIHSDAPLAHPFDDGDVAILERSVDETASKLGPDESSYRSLMRPLAADATRIAANFLGSPSAPRHPLSLGATGLRSVRSARAVAEANFEAEKARALFAGNAAHSFLPLEKPLSAMFGFVLGVLGHAYGWPLPRGGSQSISNALASYLESLGGEIYTGVRVDRVEEVPPARAVVFDVTPRQLVDIAGHHLPNRYRSSLEKYRYGSGVFKMDFALDGPIPWRNEACLRAGTVHLGGTLDEIARGEAGIWRGEHAERPFVLLAQQSLFDETRAPEGKHTVWAYCHVPNGSAVDMSERIESQIERFAPGFRDRILAKATMDTSKLESSNANLVGGDINGGVMDIRQFVARPVASINPYATPAKGLYLCSSSTPPGGAVHGMNGFMAARSALRYLG